MPSGVQVNCHEGAASSAILGTITYLILQCIARIFFFFIDSYKSPIYPCVHVI